MGFNEEVGAWIGGQIRAVRLGTKSVIRGAIGSTGSAPAHVMRTGTRGVVMFAAVGFWGCLVVAVFVVVAGVVVATADVIGVW